MASHLQHTVRVWYIVAGSSRAGRQALDRIACQTCPVSDTRPARRPVELFAFEIKVGDGKMVPRDVSAGVPWPPARRVSDVRTASSRLNSGREAPLR